ncbi:MAG: helix-turn-helix transcriptional regulator [Actinobacteria bacterium]|nr:helix-turn-helix transcriptional regulator [Actinomycetota bacterium]
MAVVGVRDSSQRILGTTELPHTDSIEPAELVRSLRRAAGLSQKGLATLLGTSQPAVSRWEQGHDEPRLSTLNAVAHACGRRLVVSVADEEKVVDGVDRAQILAHLAMSPDERIRAVANVSRFRASIELA